MKISFISLLEDVSIPSLRFLSAFIKSKGYESEIIMFPRLYSEGLNGYNLFRYPYSDILNLFVIRFNIFKINSII